MKPKVPRSPQVNWRNNAIQFPRLIAELEVAGAFFQNSSVMLRLQEDTDLTEAEISELVDRAQTEWDRIKAQIPKGRRCTPKQKSS